VAEAAIGEEAPAPAPARRRAESSEPRLERIVVSSDATAAVEGEETGSQPARKGWWQRKLGG
jgi:ribonuclease E